MADESSPRPWRCFLVPENRKYPRMVFSTSVEVFPFPQWFHVARFGLLHVRGGVSTGDRDSRPQYRSSPRPWRCFSALDDAQESVFVFSTSVEVFPSAARHFAALRCLLHVRGGVSGDQRSGPTANTSSPHPWRCFFARGLSKIDRSVFSTSVEVFPTNQNPRRRNCGLLHVRGGVSAGS